MATALVAIAVILASIAAWRLTGVWLKYSGRMVTTCPQNQIPAGVSVDTLHVLVTSIRDMPELGLSDCSRWPERAGRGQECLRQIEAAPESCLLHNILVRWYEGKSCTWCGRPLGDIHIAEWKPNMLLANQVSVEWNEIPAERLQETIETALPLASAATSLTPCAGSTRSWS